MGLGQVPGTGPHGGDGPRLARALGLDPSSILDLSQSLNPFAPDIRPIVANHLDSLRHYPSADAGEQLLAEAIGIDPARLRLTNGGSEAIALVAAEIGGQVRSEPEFGLHPRGTENGPIWRSDPHSPTGRLASDDERADVWDEAFYPLATGDWTTARPGVVVGSLTKVFACPGLRLGYIVADDVDRFVGRQPVWSVGSLGLAVLPELLALCELEAWSQSIATARDELVTMLEQRGLGVDANDAPWVLVKASGLRERLAPHGVIVRDCASFGLRGTVRVAVPDADGLARLCATLDQVDLG